MPSGVWMAILYSLGSFILAGLIFWFILRAVIRSDRTERSIAAKIEAEERAKAGLPPQRLS